MGGEPLSVTMEQPDGSFALLPLSYDAENGVMKAAVFCTQVTVEFMFIAFLSWLIQFWIISIR